MDRETAEYGRELVFQRAPEGPDEPMENGFIFDRKEWPGVYRRRNGRRNIQRSFHTAKKTVNY